LTHSEGHPSLDEFEVLLRRYAASPGDVVTFAGDFFDLYRRIERPYGPAIDRALSDLSFAIDEATDDPQTFPGSAETERKLPEYVGSVLRTLEEQHHR
jgi:hypothetical protein